MVLVITYIVADEKNIKDLMKWLKEKHFLTLWYMVNPSYIASYLATEGLPSNRRVLQ